MVCPMHAALMILDPVADIAFDLAREYGVVQQMKRGWCRS
jgi:hypothetical protein